MTLAVFGIVAHFPSRCESEGDRDLQDATGALLDSFTRPAIGVAVSHMTERLNKASSKQAEGDKRPNGIH